MGIQGKTESWLLLLWQCMDALFGGASVTDFPDRLVDSNKSSLVNHIETINNVESPLPKAASSVHKLGWGLRTLLVAGSLGAFSFTISFMMSE